MYLSDDPTGGKIRPFFENVFIVSYGQIYPPLGLSILVMIHDPKQKSRSKTLNYQKNNLQCMDQSSIIPHNVINMDTTK